MLKRTMVLERHKEHTSLRSNDPTNEYNKMYATEQELGYGRTQGSGKRRLICFHGSTGIERHIVNIHDHAPAGE